MPEFDKYAPYVWWSYAIAALVLGGMAVWSIARYLGARRRLQEIEREEAMEREGEGGRG